MPQGRSSGIVNKEALNALTDLYYLYGDLAAHIQESNESPEQLDIFFLRPGGLKQLLYKYYDLASLDPVEAGSQEKPLTQESMLLITHSISALKENADAWKQILDIRGCLKEYNNTQEAYGTPVPSEVQEAVNKGRQMLAKRTQRSRSGAEASVVDLNAAVIAYENHILIIDSVQIPLVSGSLRDLVTQYMVTRKTRGEQADVASISTWIDSESIGLQEPSGRAIKDACRAVNEIVKEKLVTAEDFFDTSRQHRVLRRY